MVLEIDDVESGGLFSFIEGNSYKYIINEDDTGDYWETLYTVIDNITGFDFSFNEFSFNLHFKK